MTDAHAHLEPELWVEDTAAAIDFYERAFGAQTVHRVGGPADPDGVAQLSIAGARFWVSGAPRRWAASARSRSGARPARLLLVVEDPHAVVAAVERARRRPDQRGGSEHGWLLGRVRDPFGHEWEIGHPLGAWPPG